MRAVHIALLVGLLAIGSWAFVMWELATLGATGVVTISLALTVSGTLLLLPWVFGLHRSGEATWCGECGQTLGASPGFGFCLRCGVFLSRQAERWYARRA